jgi:iron complex outermembrane receptor protein
VNWFPKSTFAATLTAFYSTQHDAIDYTRANAADPWQATNLSGLHFTGVEAAVDWLPASGQRVRVSWTNLTGAQSALHGLQSEYVFNYPVNNARVDWTSNAGRQLVVESRLGVVQRFEKDPYAVLDVSVVRAQGRIRPYLRMTNLMNTGYDEIVDVRMPGRGFIGGLEMDIDRHR